jgi:hypothetical protein
MEQVARDGRTVLLVSHNLGTVRALCRRALLLEGGRLGIGSAVDVVDVPGSRGDPGIKTSQVPSSGASEIRLLRVTLVNGVAGDSRAGRPFRPSGSRSVPVEDVFGSASALDGQHLHRSSGRRRWRALAVSPGPYAVGSKSTTPCAPGCTRTSVQTAAGSRCAACCSWSRYLECSPGQDGGVPASNTGYVNGRSVWHVPQPLPGPAAWAGGLAASLY